MSPLTEPTVDLRADEVPETRPSSYADEIRPENPKRNPVTYAALAIATLALLLSILALSRDTGPDQVQVGDKRCIVDRIEGNDADTLFCQQ